VPIIEIFSGTEIDNGELNNYTIAQQTEAGKQYQGVIPALKEGNIISEGEISAADIESAAPAGIVLVDYDSSPILAVSFFNGLTSVVEVSFDDGVSWVTLYPSASPSIEFGDKGRGLISDILVRKSGSTAVTGDSIVAWGTI
jgi:hypothetical protein